jgi:hypothetical protein
MSRSSGKARKRGQSYPFDLYGDVADLGFADQLLLSPEVNDEVKQHLRESFVIDATPVSDYFYEGTDQEYWDLRTDFPNIAPPYEQFFLEFKAPAKIVSQEFGERLWGDEIRPIGWGLLCDGTDATTAATILDDPEERQRVANVNESMMLGLREAVQSLYPDYCGDISDLDSLPKGSSSQEDSLLLQYKMAYAIHTLYQADAWDEVKQLLFSLFPAQGDIRWVLNMQLFVKFQCDDISPDTFRCLGPIFNFQAFVKNDGQINILDDKSPHASSALIGSAMEGVMKAYRGAERLRITEKIRDNLQPLFNTALLTLSFLHCKNVVVRPLDQTMLCHPTIKQQLDYHTLDIAPMRQILKTEGQERNTGTKRAMHICRGHFAHYENGRGLFGKYKGTFWIPQHIRGQASLASY